MSWVYAILGGTCWFGVFLFIMTVNSDYRVNYGTFNIVMAVCWFAIGLFCFLAAIRNMDWRWWQARHNARLAKICEKREKKEWQKIKKAI